MERRDNCFFERGKCILMVLKEVIEEIEVKKEVFVFFNVEFFKFMMVMDELRK